jgi:NAD(P)H-flavin reductase
MEKDTNGIFQCNIFVTNRDYKNSLENGDSTSSYQQQGTTRVSNNLQLRRATVTLSGHRMDVSSYIQEFAKYGRNSIVYVCGPTSLVDQCMDLSIEHDIEFKQETFLL